MAAVVAVAAGVFVGIGVWDGGRVAVTRGVAVTGTPNGEVAVGIGVLVETSVGSGVTVATRPSSLSTVGGSVGTTVAVGVGGASGLLGASQ